MLRRGSCVLVVAALSFALMPGASGATLRWIRKVGDDAKAVAVDGHGNVYVAGSTSVSNGDTAAYLVKYGPAGGRQWSRSWSPLASDYAFGTAVAVADDGTVYWGGVLHTGGCEGGGWFVRALTPNGRALWHRDQDGWEACKVATRLTDLGTSRDVLALSLTDHGCCADPFADGYIRALDPDSGRLLWRTDIEPPADVPTALYDTATSVSAGGLGNLFVGGWAATETIPNDGSRDADGIAFVQKLSPGGAVLWRRTVRVTTVWPVDVQVSARGDRLMVATIARGGQLWWGEGKPPVGWLGRFSLGGDLMWSRTWGDGWHHGAEPGGVSIEPDMDTWVVGTTRDASDRGYDLFARRFSSHGRLLQKIRLDGPTKVLRGEDVAAVAGGAALAGDVQSNERYSGRVLMYGPA